MASNYDMNLVTGARGKEHITSADDGSLYASIYGRGQYVMHGFSYTLVNSGLIRIAEGDALINGRHCRINHGYVADLQLAAGSNGLNRIDLVVITYRKNTETDEKAVLEVITGTATSGTALEPSYAAGNVLNGDRVVQFPLYRISYTGINMPVVTRMFEPQNSMIEMVENIMSVLIPPVGWIEYNDTGKNPEERYPGTKWELYGAGRFEACVNTSDTDFSKGKTGGSKNITLSVAQLPSHHHITKAHAHGLNNHSHTIPKLTGTTISGGEHTHKAYYTKDAAAGSAKTRYFPNGEFESSDNFIDTSGKHSHKITTNEGTTSGSNGNTANSADNNTSDIGSGQNINILPPYITVYRWKRVQ